MQILPWFWCEETPPPSVEGWTMTIEEDRRDEPRDSRSAIAIASGHKGHAALGPNGGFSRPAG